MKPNPSTSNDISFDDFKSQILQDYETAVTSRECSVMGRREVLSGKAKFGILEMERNFHSWPWQGHFKMVILGAGITVTRPL